MTLRLKRLRTLRLRSSGEAGRSRHISAASGLVPVGDRLYVIADDELHLGVFPAKGTGAGSLIRLLPGELPKGPKKRKASKADFEVLVLLPKFAGCPHGALLALGSGSRPNRRRGVLVPLDRSGAATVAVRVIDLAGLYAMLEEQLGTLNLEGAVVLGQRLCLLNRGRSRKGGNACVFVNLRAVQRSIARSNAITALPFKVRYHDLGTAHGVPLGFTDGAALPDGSLVFTAVAENSEDSYQDGPCVGAAVGVIRPDGEVDWMRKLKPVRKVEGIALRPGSRGRGLLLVSDADDAAVPAALYAAELE